MADQEKSSDERTENATAFRREEFRKQGMVAMSRELIGALILSATGATLYMSAGKILSEFHLLSEKFFRFTGKDWTKEDLMLSRMFILEHWAWMTIPILAVAIVTGIVVSAAQVGLYLTWEPIEPNWERINPISGMQRFFSMKNIVEGIKAVLKLTVVSLIVYFFIKSQAEKTLPLLSLPVHESLIVTLQSVMKLFFILTGSLLVLGALDYGYQRYELESRMKMTKREAKDEFKLREGDPLIKSRIRSIQRKMASKRMMEAVPKADVVITNPTHFAVALQYNEKEMAAPKVIAKGADIVAQKIKEVAKFHRIPCVENRPLARTLFKNVEINQYVPRDLYKAVAEVLAYVYRLRGRIANG